MLFLVLISFIFGFLFGALIIGFYIKKNLRNISTNPKQIQKMAKNMGVNLSQKQLNMVSGIVNKNKK